MAANDPHAGLRVVSAGRPLEQADAALIMVHGRGASAESILDLRQELAAEGYACLAPQANGYTWYPLSFLAPIASNEPYLSSALAALRRVLAQVEGAGIPPERTVLLGFSQGACLSTEFVARNARRYGGVIAFSGGLIGPEGTPRDYAGSLAGTPVFLGCSDVDPHIPLARVQESTRVLQGLGADVTERIYPGMGHTVNRDEIDHANQILSGVVSGGGEA